MRVTALVSGEIQHLGPSVHGLWLHDASCQISCFAFYFWFSAPDPILATLSPHPTTEERSECTG